MSSRPPLVPERFQVAKATLRFDRFMNVAIRFGGIGIIIAVFGIFVFIFSQVYPLFQKAKVSEIGELKFADGAEPLVFGIDEWGELPFYYDGGEDVTFVASDTGEVRLKLPVNLPDGTRVTAANYLPVDGMIVVGTSDGRVGSFTVSYSPSFGEGGERTIIPSLSVGAFYEVGSGAPIEMVGYGDGGNTKVIAAIQEAQETNGAKELHAVLLQQRRSLMGSGAIEKVGDLDLTSELTGSPLILRVPRTGDGVIVATDTGAVDYFHISGTTATKRQVFAPFGEDGTVSSMDFVFGDVSLVMTNPQGEMLVYSLLVPEGESTRVYVPIKSFEPLEGPATFFAKSQRNKLFLTGSGSQISLRHSTTEQIRWQSDVGFDIKGAVIDAKGASFALMDAEGGLHLYALDDPHPEASWKAYFGKVWYEGATHPDYTWQSTSGTDDFEPKLSLRPLIHGSLKGTVWALMFAVPIAILAAIYTAQFLRPEIKRIVKPSMEIMASLPSVVLGFLAALWLAPLIETKVPSVFMVLLGIPVLAMVTGILWSRLPTEKRALLKPGSEWLAFLPLMMVASWLLWQFGPVVESWICVVRNEAGQPMINPDTGKVVTDFRLWWPQVTGTSFDQRNSLVVGFMMGFAVIPIIFTISEDALSNVPSSLTAASSALGASRWQTLQTVVLPIASAGIFSALMIGFGRAVGETMIVVMATGNTPIMDWNLFSGMRTLSANIATELPEAPVHSTLYRTLFLGALVLFLMTFTLNTVAEVLRQRLREKYKLV